MYLYVELWNVTQRWMDLSIEERTNFFDKLGPGINDMLNNGIEVTGWALNDEHTPYRSDYRYMAVWKMPTLQDVEQLEKAVADSGWHEYFSQVNARGEIMPLNDVIGKLINLEKQSTSLLD